MGRGGEASEQTEFAKDSFHGPTSDLQIHNFLEWGPALEGVIFTEMVQKESFKWFQPGFLSRSHDQCRVITSLVPSHRVLLVLWEHQCGV